NLGKVVSMAFAKERAERQAIIERAVREQAHERAATPAREPAPIPTIPAAVTELDEATAARPAPPQPAARPGRQPQPQHEVVWWWRVAAVCGLLATVMMALVVVERWRPASRDAHAAPAAARSEEHTSELQSRRDLVCRLLLEKK